MGSKCTSFVFFEITPVSLLVWQFVHLSFVKVFLHNHLQKFSNFAHDVRMLSRKISSFFFWRRSQYAGFKWAQNEVFKFYENQLMEILYFGVFVFSALNYLFFLILCMKLRNRCQILLLSLTQLTFTCSKSAIAT